MTVLRSPQRCWSDVHCLLTAWKQSCGESVRLIRVKKAMTVNVNHTCGKRDERCWRSPHFRHHLNGNRKTNDVVTYLQQCGEVATTPNYFVVLRRVAASSRTRRLSCAILIPPRTFFFFFETVSLVITRAALLLGAVYSAVTSLSSAPSTWSRASILDASQHLWRSHGNLR